MEGNQKFSKIARVLELTTYPLYLFQDLIGAAAFGWLFRIGANKLFCFVRDRQHVDCHSPRRCSSARASIARWIAIELGPHQRSVSISAKVNQAAVNIVKRPA